jgi:hypothetical protein
MFTILATAILLGATLTAAATDCTCRAHGRSYELGQTTCLATPNGFRRATCGMVLNNTSWQFSQTPCVAADNDALRGVRPPNPQAHGG